MARPDPSRSPTRLCLQGILFVLYAGIPWQQLPLELGFGSGQTCGRRLERWQETGAFDQLHRALLAELNAAGELVLESRVRGRPPRARERGAPMVSVKRR
ncbi:transposase [Kitasatospora sp. NPDC048540]|uniref:transposase n=1 Tax=Kitasatospora sp. NPDC048540 TaxID=3155634 RepID=UPI0033FAF204